MGGEGKANKEPEDALHIVQLRSLREADSAWRREVQEVRDTSGLVSDR